MLQAPLPPYFASRRSHETTHLSDKEKKKILAIFIFSLFRQQEHSRSQDFALEGCHLQERKKSLYKGNEKKKKKKIRVAIFFPLSHSLRLPPARCSLHARAEKLCCALTPYLQKRASDTDLTLGVCVCVCFKTKHESNQPGEKQISVVKSSRHRRADRGATFPIASLPRHRPRCDPPKCVSPKAPTETSFVRNGAPKPKRGKDKLRKRFRSLPLHVIFFWHMQQQQRLTARKRKKNERRGFWKREKRQTNDGREFSFSPNEARDDG